MTKIVIYNTFEPVVTLLRDLPERLSEHGFEVEIVISRSEYRSRPDNLSAYFRATNVRVTRVGLKFSNPVSKRWEKISVMLSYMCLAGFHVFRRNADVRIFLTQPPMFAITGALKKKYRNEKYIYVLWDLYPEVLEAHGIIKSQGIISRSLNKLSKFSRSYADVLISIGEDMTRYLVNTGVDRKTITYIPNWSGLDERGRLPVAENQLRREFGFSSEDLLVMYSGNMGVSHYFADLLEVANRTQADEKIKYVFVGGGARRAEIERFSKTNRLKNIYMFEYQLANRLHESLSVADVHFVSLNTGYGGLVVPSKVFGAMCVGRPILYQGESETELARMLEQHKCGIQVSIGDVERLYQSILHYADHHTLREEHGIAALKAYKNNYSKSVGVGKYVKVIEKLIDAN